jgi:hypothetical protein
LVVRSDIRLLIDDMHSRLSRRYRHLVQAFIQFDTDSVRTRQDGQLSLNEFLNAMQSLSVPCSLDEQVQMFKVLDEDKDNFLTFHEFSGVKGDYSPSGRVSVQREDLAAMNDSVFRHPLYYMPRKRRLQSLTLPKLDTSVMGPVLPQRQSDKGNKSVELRPKKKRYGVLKPFLP